MTGAGRTGAFLAGEHWDVAPDILVLSKGFAAGYMPLGAMVAHDRVVDPVLDAGGFLHGYTYAGNPLACAAGLAVLDEIARQDLCANAAKRGAELKARLVRLMERHVLVGDVRGMGLLLAFEFMDRDTGAPLLPELKTADRFVEIAYEMGLIVYARRSRGGRAGDHIMVCPPLIVSDTHLDEIEEVLDRALTELARQLAPALAKAG